ncbi:MAG: ATPase [Flavobacteriales bacterium]|nr:ATPase [Flavobacteriales bacterium]
MINALKKINFLITKRQRKGLVILTLLLFAGMILEIFGLGILIPVISILMDPEMIDKNPFILSIKILFNDFSHQKFILFFLLATVFLYSIKTIFLIFLTHKQNRFLNNTIAYISNNLFSIYLNQPYEFHIKRNTSELIKNLQVEINLLSAFLQSLITVFIEGGFMLSIIATLIYIEPFGAIFIGLIYGFLSVLFLQFTKKKINQWGKFRQKLDNQVSKIALEGIGGIKDILILGKASFFVDEFSKKNYFKSRINSNQSTISQIPRFYFELISIIGLVTFILFLLFEGKDLTIIITTLGVFVAATFRMIPSLNRIIAASQSLKYYKSSLDIIYNETKGFGKVNFNHLEKFNFKNKIELKNIHFNFNNSINILNGINLTIRKGETIGIIGESGSGKSTLIDLILGLHLPTSGEILIDSVPDFQMSQSWRNKIGYVSQAIYLTDDTIENNVAFGLPNNKIDKARVIEVIKQVQLEKFTTNLELGLNTTVGERGIQLSGGQMQRIGIARALYNHPNILILDEATSALDIKTESDVMKSVDNLKGDKTVIIITHRLKTLRKCDTIYRLVDGRIKMVPITI